MMLKLSVLNDYGVAQPLEDLCFLKLHAYQTPFGQWMKRIDTTWSFPDESVFSLP